MKQLLYIVLLGFFILFITSAGCSLLEGPKLRIHERLYDETKGYSYDMTVELYDDGHGFLIFEFNNGLYNSDDLDTPGLTGYVKEIRYGLRYNEVAPDKYNLQMESISVKTYNGESNYVELDELGDMGSLFKNDKGEYEFGEKILY